MRKLYATLSLILLVSEILAIICAVEKPAYGYVDPGSGLLAFQILCTTFAGMIFVLRRRLRSIFDYIAGHYRSDSQKACKR